MKKELDPQNVYTQMQRNFYTGSETGRMAKLNHKNHNDNPDYWDVLLREIKESPETWAGKAALDFGCGCGRNVENLLELADFVVVDGCDISSTNCEYTKNYLKGLGFDENRFDAFTTDGVSLTGIPEEKKYDFVMSTIVLQHICVHEIRYRIKQDIFEHLNPGGLFSFQMGTGKPRAKVIPYNNNHYKAKSTNSGMDCTVDNVDYLLHDLDKIGFVNVSYEIRESFSNAVHPEWIYVKAYKPTE